LASHHSKPRPFSTKSSTRNPSCEPPRWCRPNRIVRRIFPFLPDPPSRDRPSHAGIWLTSRLSPFPHCAPGGLPGCPSHSHIVLAPRAPARASRTRLRPRTTTLPSSLWTASRVRREETLLSCKPSLSVAPSVGFSGVDSLRPIRVDNETSFYSHRRRPSIIPVPDATAPTMAETRPIPAIAHPASPLRSAL
jgi:hypothetical protein